MFVQRDGDKGVVSSRLSVNIWTDDRVGLSVKWVCDWSQLRNGRPAENSWLWEGSTAVSPES